MKRCLLGLLCLFISIQSFGQTLESDRLALIAFYQATGGNNWYDNTGWVVPGNPGDNPCGWYGVTCEGGRVTKLVIKDNDIVAPIPAAVGGLSALKHLDLSGPGGELLYFYGDLPAELGNLSNLEYLDLSGNQLTGVNVSVINNLTNLKHLSLTPYYYWTTLPSFANLVNLEYLRLAVEDYSPFQSNGAIGPIPAYIGSFTKLKTLIMRYGGVTGNIPSNLGDLTNLEVLDLSQNQLTGTIPASFKNLTKLTKLDLSNNNLTGPIPDILGIPVAASVDVSNNFFGLVGTIENRTVLDKYAPQGLISLIVTPGFPNFSVIKAEGVQAYHATNGYKYFRDEVEVPSNQEYGDYWATEKGSYRIEVRNSLLPDLILSTNTEFVEPPMPVTLISFDSKFESNQTKLTWKTAEEMNNKGFEIERSADARTFEKIGFVDGNGDTEDDKTYHFTDLNPFATTYYRLKQLDYDGKFEYSRVIAVKGEGPILNIFPNPAQEYLSVSGIGQNRQLTIIDQNGRVVLKRQVAEKEQVRIGRLVSGIYTVKMGNQSRKLLIDK